MLEGPKVSSTWCVFNILAWKSASRRSRVQIVIRSKSAPSLRWFLTVWLGKFALRQRRVQFYTSHPPRWPRTCCFSKPARRPGATKHGKKTNVLWLFYFFARFDILSTHSLFSESFSSLPPRTAVAASVHKSEVWLLNFLRWWVCLVLINLRKACRRQTTARVPNPGNRIPYPHPNHVEMEVRMVGVTCLGATRMGDFTTL